MTETSAPRARQPKGIPVGGQFAASAHAESGVALTDQTAGQPSSATAGSDFAERFRAEVANLDHRWREEADVHGTFNGQILALGRRVLDASEPDRPGYDKLADAVAAFADDKTDDDAAEEVLFSLEDITDATNMGVVENGTGGHLRVADGKQAHTCPDCGNGYATRAVLHLHRQQDCAGNTDEDGTGDAADEETHDALHSAAESFASEINQTGVDEQIAFLRRNGVTDEEMIEAVQAADDTDRALDDLVIDTASQSASQAYNDGASDGSDVTRTLDGQRWMLTGDKTPVAKHPAALEPGECTHIAITDPASGQTLTYRVTYNEWVPDGDNGLPARDYRRGEFSMESEWAQHEYVPARESSPFRPERGERSQMVGYAWEQFASSLHASARATARARASDPVRRALAENDQ